MGELTFETARGRDRWKLPQYTPDQVRALPAVVGLVDAARAWGLSEAQAYELARLDRLPFRAIRLGAAATARKQDGGRWKVLRADLLQSLLIPEVEPV